MIKLKVAMASAASFAILALTPVAAYADACNQCYGACTDAYGEDNSESGYYNLSQCYNFCNAPGGACAETAPG